MMKALKEYNEMVMRPSWKWLIKHWKGYSVFVAIVMIVPYIWIYWNDIIECVKSKFTEKEEEES